MNHSPLLPEWGPAEPDVPFLPGHDGADVAAEAAHVGRIEMDHPEALVLALGEMFTGRDRYISGRWKSGDCS